MTDNPKNKFEYTREGYEEAQAFLRKNKKELLLDYELSRDGYTIVALANSVYNDGLKDFIDE